MPNPEHAPRDNEDGNRLRATDVKQFIGHICIIVAGLCVTAMILGVQHGAQKAFVGSPHHASP